MSQYAIFHIARYCQVSVVTNKTGFGRIVLKTGSDSNDLSPKNILPSVQYGGYK